MAHINNASQRHLCFNNPVDGLGFTHNEACNPFSVNQQTYSAQSLSFSPFRYLVATPKQTYFESQKAHSSVVHSWITPTTSLIQEKEYSSGGAPLHVSFCKQYARDSSGKITPRIGVELIDDSTKPYPESSCYLIRELNPETQTTSLFGVPYSRFNTSIEYQRAVLDVTDHWETSSQYQEEAKAREIISNKFPFLPSSLRHEFFDSHRLHLTLISWTNNPQDHRHSFEAEVIAKAETMLPPKVLSRSKDHGEDFIRVYCDVDDDFLTMPAKKGAPIGEVLYKLDLYDDSAKSLFDFDLKYDGKDLLALEPAPIIDRQNMEMIHNLEAKVVPCPIESINQMLLGRVSVGGGSTLESFPAEVSSVENIQGILLHAYADKKYRDPLRPTRARASDNGSIPLCAH